MRVGMVFHQARRCCDSCFTDRCSYFVSTMRPVQSERPPRCCVNTKGFSRVSSDRLLDDFNAGKAAALARVVSIVENHRDRFEEILGSLHPRTGRARRIGLTGPPGAGKSTITSLLVKKFRDEGLKVGVIAVDPTSPF